ncbi:MAG: TolC family protein [Calditerrivibrio sp.]|nr:TolC family protein [Calditerrivibrio sp.]
MKKSLLFILFPTLVFSAELTIENAIKLGLKENLSIKAKEHQIKSTLWTFEAAKSDNFPSIVADYTYTKMDEKKQLSLNTLGGTMKVTQVEETYNTLNLGIQYNFYTGGLVTALVDIAKKNVEKSQHDHTELSNEIRYQIQNAYINILELYAIRQLYEKEIESLRAHQKDVELLHHQGLAAKIDILHTSVKVKEVEKKIFEINNNIKIAKLNLRMLLGQEPDDNFDVLEIDRDFLNTQIDETKIIEQAYSNRAILKSLKADLENLKKTLEIEKSAYMPKAFIYGGYNYTDSNEAISPKGGFLLQAGLKFKLDWDKPSNLLKGKKEEIYAFENKLKEVKYRIKIAVQKSIEDFYTAIKTYDLANQQLKEADEYFRVMNLKYKNGLASNTDLLDAEAMLTAARISTKKAYYDIARAFYKIEFESASEVK